MIIALDVQYYNDCAKTVAIWFKNWQDDKPARIVEKIVSNVNEYVPGEFYKRELPCILSILNETDLNEVAQIIVDGYVHLDDSGKFGLGGHLYNELKGKTPVIGVAKSKFRSNTKNVIELLRGQSKRPLYVSSIGIEKEKACELIKSMHGKFRIPTLLQILDTKTKE